MTIKNISEILDDMCQIDAVKFNRAIVTETDLVEAIKQFPSHASQLIEYVLANKNEFKRLIGYLNYRLFIKIVPLVPDHAIDLLKQAIDYRWDFCKLTNLFPAYASQLIGYIKSNDNEFKRIVYAGIAGTMKDDHAADLIEHALDDHQDYTKFQCLITPNGDCKDSDLIEVARNSPKYASRLIEYVLSHYDAFKVLFNSSSKLKKLTKQFPNHIPQIIGHVLSDKNEVKKFSLSYLYGIAKSYPPYAGTLIEIALNDENEFKRLIHSDKVLLEIAALYPKYAAQLIEYVLNNHEEFERLIDCSEVLHEVIQCSPEHETALIKHAFDFERLINARWSLQNIVKSYPDHALVVMEKALAQNKLHHFITYGWELRELAAQLPNDINRIMDYVLSHYDLFNRVICSSNELERLVHEFPDYAAQLNKNYLLYPPDHDHFIFTEKSREDIHRFCSKLDKFYRDDTLQAETQYKSCFEFINDNQDKIFNIFLIFGDQAPGLLLSKLVSSPLPLERFFSSYLLVEKEIALFCRDILRHKHHHLTYAEKDQLAGLFCITSDLFCNARDNLLNNLNQNFEKASDLIDFLYTECLRVILKSIDTKEIDLPIIKNKLPLHRFLILANGIRSLKDRDKYKSTNYHALIHEMLRADLCKDHSFEHFSHSKENNTKLGEALAHHNQAIEKILTANKIDTNIAFHYDKEKSFTYGSNKYDFAQQALAIIILLSKITPNGVCGRSHLEKHVTNFLTQFFKGYHGNQDALNTLPNEMVKRILDNSMVILIQKIMTNLKILINEIQTPSFNGDQTLKEYLPLFNNYYNQLLSWMTNLPNIQNAIDEKKFRVKQWNKNDINTLFLGNDLSCCLATNGQFFHAILERRLDKACLMHVVINESTGEPICGNWLFFAKDRDNPWGGVYVVANFFEIKQNYTTNSDLRDLLVESLCQFTTQFAMDIKAKDFIIRPLTYGNIPDFEGYELVDMKLTKVGGFFNSKNYSTEYKDNYFLNALHLDQFYQAPKIDLDLKLNLDPEPTQPETAVKVSSQSIFTRSEIAPQVPEVLEARASSTIEL